MTKSLPSSDDGHADSSEIIESDFSVGSSAAVIGDPSSCCSPAIFGPRSRYCTTAFWGSYPWSLTIRLTVRLQTPPCALRTFQYIWLAFVSGWASGAKVAERSVRTPSVIVLSVTPGPPFTSPDDDPPELESEPLLPQAARARATSTRAMPLAAWRNVRLMTCSPW